MSERILNDLAKRLDDKIYQDMSDFMDLCSRADCDMEVAQHHMISLMVKEALTGMMAIGMDRKEILAAVGKADDLMRPRVMKALKEQERKHVLET